MDRIKKHFTLLFNGWTGNLFSIGFYVKKEWLKECSELGDKAHTSKNWYRCETLESAYKIYLEDKKLK